MKRSTVMVLALLLAGCNLFRSEPRPEDPLPSTDTDVPSSDVANATDMGTAGGDAGNDTGDPGGDVGADVGADVSVIDMSPPVDMGPVPDLGWDRGTGRVTRNLLLYYTFEEGTGTTVIDRAPRGATSALTLGPTATWLAGRNGVHVDGPERITSMAAGTELWDAVVPREEITVELWFKPDNLTQTGPARLVTFSADSSTRNFTLGQSATSLVLRLSVNDREFSANGTPSIEALGAAVLSETHLAFTYDGLTATLYVNGVAVGSDLRTGGLQHWDRLQPFLLGNENAATRDWAGEFYMLSVYDRALSAAEIARNFSQGSNVTP